MNNFDLIIIGAGPAGLTAGIYASRAGIKTIIIEKNAPGGKMNNTHQIDNYPGMEGKKGWEFSKLFLEQAKKFGSKIKGGEVISISNLDSKDQKKVVLSNGQEFFSKTIIIASGLSPKKLDVPGFDEYFGKGIGVCIVCDGAFYKDKEIAVVGGGNSAIEETLFSADMMKKIYIINKFPSFIGEKITLEKLNKKRNVVSIHNANVKSINGDDGKVKSITFSIKNKKEKTINVQGVFTYVGWNTESSFIKDKKLIDENGFVLIDQETNETMYPGVYAAGDIINKEHRQVTIAASEGTKSALAAISYVNKL